MPGAKRLPLRPARADAESKGGGGLRARAPLFPCSARLRKGSGGSLRAFPPGPAFALAAPVPPAPPERRAVLRPVPLFVGRDRKAASARLPFLFPPLAPAAAPLASGPRTRLQAARPAPSAVALNPGEAARLSAGHNA